MRNAEISRFLNDSFNVEELKTLYFKLGLDFSHLANLSNKGDITEDLIKRCAKSIDKSELMQLLQEERPLLFGLPRKIYKPQSFLVPKSEAEFLELNRVDLLNLITSHFSMAHLHSLTVELKVDETRLSGITLHGFTRDFIVQLEANGELARLCKRLSEHFLEDKLILPNQAERQSNYDQQQKLAQSRREQIPDMHDSLPSLAEKVAFYLSSDDIKIVCFDLGVDWENLNGVDQHAKAASLVAFCRQEKQIDELISVLQLEYPAIVWADSIDI